MYVDGAFAVLEIAVSLFVIVSGAVRPLVSAFKVDVLAKSLSGVMVVSTAVPRVGEYVLSRESGIGRFRGWFDEAIGSDMVQFRRDMRMMFVRHSSVGEDVREKPELVREIEATREQLRRRHDVGELLVSVVIALIALGVSFVSVPWAIVVFLGLYTLFLPLSVFMRNTVLDTLCYSGVPLEDEDEYESVLVRRRITLLFMMGWNRMLVRNEAVVHKLVFISAVRGEFVLGYEKGRELIEGVYKEDLTVEEAFDKLVEREMADYPKAAERVRGAVRRFVGV